VDNVILVADSDEVRRERFIDALDGVGFRCLAAATGSEALATATRYAPQLAIVRSELPEVQGTDVCLRLKQEDPTGGRAVILITTAASTEEEFVASEVGADLYLTEPEDMPTFIEQVRDLFYEDRLNAAARGLRESESEEEA